MNLKFLTNKPAALLGDKLIICELHFGIELSMQRRGLNVPLEPKKYAEELNQLARETSAKQLIVIGDFKHTITGFDQRERNYFNELIHGLRFERITIVKGNHDSRIEEMCRPFSKIKVEPPSGMALRQGRASYGLFHGHAAASEEVMKCSYLLTGHNHAGIQVGEGEFSRTEPAWIVIPFKKTRQKLIAFPSFNPLSGAVPFNILTAKELHGPIFRHREIDLENAEVIMLNGQRIGKIKFLRQKKR